MSNLPDARCGASQSSMLGDFLSPIYITDLNLAINLLKSTTLLMILIYQVSKNWYINKLFNHDLKNFENSLKAYKISLNSYKTKLVLFVSPKKKLDNNLKTKLNGIRLKQMHINIWKLKLKKLNLETKG